MGPTSVKGLVCTLMKLLAALCQDKPGGSAPWASCTPAPPGSTRASKQVGPSVTKSLLVTPVFLITVSGSLDRNMGSLVLIV